MKTTIKVEQPEEQPWIFIKDPFKENTWVFIPF